MTNEMSIRRPALRIEQPLGTFYVFSLDAKTLNQVTYSQPATARRLMEVEENPKGLYGIFGTQRKEKPTRLDEIAAFIKTNEATFPNSIILGANYYEDGTLVEDENKRWSVEEKDGSIHILIPNTGKTASIIDGQHRLHAFERAPDMNMDLLCVAYIDLPMPFHAYIFATINFNQKKVDRSLAYELFGFDVEEREPTYWPPETLAVYTARVLNAEPTSSLHQCITPALDTVDRPPASGPKIRVSLATVVDGILKLISKNPKDDRYLIRKKENLEKGRAVFAPDTNLPLRAFYIEGRDKAVYEIVSNYFRAVSLTLWNAADETSYLRKTVGVQAFFDVLKIMLTREPISAANFSVDALEAKFGRCLHLAANDHYQASGIGRSQIKRDLLKALGLGE